MFTLMQGIMVFACRREIGMERKFRQSLGQNSCSDDGWK